MSTRKGRREAGAFIADGAQAVREALSAGVAERFFFVDGAPHALEFAGAVEQAQLDAFVLDEREMAAVTDTVTPQGVAVEVRRAAIEIPWDRAADALSDEPQLIVICAQVRDPGNAGTVIRCADAFGADAVIMTSGSVELTNPKLIRASVGSVFHLPVVTGADLKQAAKTLRGKGMQLLAADGGGQLLDAVDLSGPTAWIMGNEAWGLPAGDQDVADHVVGIPMWGKAESLNLSTAAAVCLFATASAQRSSL